MDIQSTYKAKRDAKKLVVKSERQGKSVKSRLGWVYVYYYDVIGILVI
jgi:hypothetical protein